MILWSIARTSAFVAFAAYTFVIAWGMLIAAKVARPAAPAVATHRFLSSLGLIAIATHVTALLLDSYAKVSPRMLVGMDSRPSLIAGAIAMWLCVALPLSFRLRKAKWISQRVWRGFHWLGYAVWALALGHGITSGSDTSSPFAMAAYAGAAAVVLLASLYRVGATRSRRAATATAR
jgi:sulfoxide reductase heme-binding subunit YedZ